MTVRPGGHEFADSGDAKYGTDGRRFALCRCGLPRRAACHQPPDPRSRKVPAPTPVPVVREPDPEPREVALFRLASDLLLARPETPTTVRVVVQAAIRALTTGDESAPGSVAPLGASATPTTRPSRRGDVRWVRRVLTGRYWSDIAVPALDQGYVAKRTGNGHIRFERGLQAFSLSTTIREGAGHGFDNARAAARRAGVRC